MWPEEKELHRLKVIHRAWEDARQLGIQINQEQIEKLVDRILRWDEIYRQSASHGVGGHLMQGDE
jgi:hypothetical protein